ncbi:MAG: Stealth CR1 domain-containing protein, partial [Bacteroidales bacterium]|nr:Stealth CR1 domain-containing protein [Bacteroidales bacterium]
MKIDFVVTWVDMDDPKWKQNFEKFAGKIDNTNNGTSEARFRDYGFLKYWFRGVEKFAPWVNKIHFVTCGQKPDWLDTNNPKINLVNHEDYIPTQFLPCFNSTVLEHYMHKIPNLSEH